MTHEAAIEAAVRAVDDFPGMSCFVNSKQRNEEWVKTIIQAYLYASGMVLVPREANEEILANNAILGSWFDIEEAKEIWGGLTSAHPDPFKSKP